MFLHFINYMFVQYLACSPLIKFKLGPLREKVWAPCSKTFVLCCCTTVFAVFYSLFSASPFATLVSQLFTYDSSVVLCLSKRKSKQTLVQQSLMHRLPDQNWKMWIVRMSCIQEHCHGVVNITLNI